MNVRIMIDICAKSSISRLKIGVAMAISIVAMATATLILLLDVVFELIEGRVSLYIFICFPCRQVSVHYVFFQRN